MSIGKKQNMKRLLITIYAFCSFLTVFSQNRPTPEQLGSIYYAYPAPAEAPVPAPEGYEPFYISHYGRHGSRWMTDDVRYVAMVSLFDSLYRYNQLTALGQDVRLRLHRVWDDARGRSGNITPLGERQHHDIAVRMYRNFPQVFHDSAVVDARSSTSLRCAMSMSYFTDGLKEQNPSLRITRRAYGEYMNYIAYTSPEGEAFSSEQAAWRKDFHAFERRMIRPVRLMKSLFLHAENFSEKQSADVMTSLYWIAADMQNVDLCGQVSFYDLFQYDELRDFWRTVNARMYVCNAAAPLNEGVMPRCASNLLNDIVVKADAAISGRSTDADLRFGHDTHLIRLLALMQMEGCANQEADIDKFHLVWQDYKVSPMGANLQLVFYRASGKDVLVRFLLNEHEAKLPIPSVEGSFYRWEDVKRFWQQVAPAQGGDVK